MSTNTERDVWRETRHRINGVCKQSSNFEKCCVEIETRKAELELDEQFVQNEVNQGKEMLETLRQGSKGRENENLGFSSSDRTRNTDTRTIGVRDKQTSEASQGKAGSVIGILFGDSIRPS